MRTTAKLSDIVEEWVFNTDILQATRIDYKNKIGRWFRWLSANDIDTRDPLKSHILRYKQYLIDEGKSVYTVNSQMTVIKLFYSYCDGAGYCNNIASGIKCNRRRTGYSKRALTSQQAFRLLDSIDTTNVIGQRDRLMISLMLFNGLRTCEVERVNISDFSKRENEPILYIQRKGHRDKDDIVVLHPATVEWFEEYIADRNFNDDSPLFISHKSKCNNRLTKQTISHLIKRHLRAIGIDDKTITAHSLRHTYGCLMVEQGIDIETIKDMMGHTDTKTTRIYVEMAQKRRLLHHSPSIVIGDKILSKIGQK